MALVTARAVLLRSHPYGDTSRILRFFTDELGVVGVMAKGIRRTGSKSGGGVETFVGGDLTLYVKETRDLQTLKEFAPVRPRRGLARSVQRFAAASVLAEIVLRHGGEAAAPELFDALERGLDRLEDASEDLLESVLLAHGWGLVSRLGYHPVLGQCVACGRTLEREMARFDFGAGGVRCGACTGDLAGPRVGPLARRQVAGLLEGREAPVTRPRAHLQLLADFVTYHLSGSRPLRSFPFLAGVLPPEADAREGEEGSEEWET